MGSCMRVGRNKTGQHYGGLDGWVDREMGGFMDVFVDGWMY